MAYIQMQKKKKNVGPLIYLINDISVNDTDPREGIPNSDEYDLT